MSKHSRRRYITEPFGKAGLIVAALALVLATIGGAYAAENAGDSAKRNNKNGSAAVAKKFAKKFSRQFSLRFAKRFAIPGPAGPVGLPGAAGADGDDGSDGSDGTDGAPGKSVDLTEIAEGEVGCESRGGVEVEVEGSGSPVEVCNGAEGAKGDEGSPWTAGGTLPQGATSTGTWAISGEVAALAEPEFVAGFHDYFAAVSLPIPLAAAPEASKVKYTATEPDPTNCPGSAANPTAAEGYVCIYEAHNAGNAGFAGIGNPTVAGVTFSFLPPPEPGTISASGTWAVTGS